MVESQGRTGAHRDLHQAGSFETVTTAAALMSIFVEVSLKRLRDVSVTWCVLIFTSFVSVLMSTWRVMNPF